jgi:outer membrane protein assembly factor BamB
MNKIVGATNMGGVSAMSIRDVVSRCALAIGLFLGGDLSASAAPAITLLPLVGPPKTKLVISGTGFDPTRLIDIYFDTTDFCLAASDASGAFSCTINVPSSAQPQNHWITAAERVNGLAAQKAFTVRTDWPQFHGRDAKHTGYNKFENTLYAFNAVTAAPVPGFPVIVDAGFSIDATPSIANDRLFIGSFDGKLYGFNALNGSTLPNYPVSTGV